jgi:hypothetical protein
MKCFNCGDDDESETLQLSGYCRECFDHFADLYEAEHQHYTWKDEAGAAILIGLVITIVGLFIGSILK